MSPKNFETYTRLFLQILVIFVGIGCLFMGIYWDSIQIRLLPESIQKCGDTAKVLGKSIDMKIALLITGIVLIIIGFAESVTMLIKAIKNGRRK